MGIFAGVHSGPRPIRKRRGHIWSRYQVDKRKDVKLTGLEAI